MRRLQDKMLAPEKRKLARLMTLYLKDVGAVKRDEGRMYPWTLETKCGTLELDPHADEFGYCVHSRFLEPARAKAKGLDCNPYSGKWNFYWNRMTAAEALDNFRRHLSSVL